MRRTSQLLQQAGLAAACCLMVLLGGCAAQFDGNALAKFDAGPYRVIKNDTYRITDPLQSRELVLRVFYPDADGPFPVVVFSTGMFCTPQLYDRVLDHWVSHGYIVVQPNHMDSPNNEGKIPMQELLNIFPTRMRDVSFIVDALPQIERELGLEGRMLKERVAISGHSFGAVVSMVKTGLILKEEKRGDLGPTYDDRFQAAVLLSGTGMGMDEFADNAFSGLRKPLFASGGTEDIGRVNTGGMAGREWRMQPFLLSPAIDKYSLITAGTDHYMGGLICNAERGGEPDYDALAIVRATTTVFLDAYLKDDAAALDYLQTIDIPAATRGRAEFVFRLKPTP